MKNVIEINGTNYDARTGKILSSEAGNQVKTNPATPKPVAPTPPNSGAFLDGVSRRKPGTSKPLPRLQLKTTKQSIPSKKNNQATVSRALDIKPSLSKTQRANTLLRSAVKKPQKTAPQIHSTSTIVHSKVERSATGRGLLLKRIPDTRLARAKLTAKSSAIQKFTSDRISKKPILSSNLTVATPPAHHSGAPAVAPAIVKPALGGHEQKQQVFNHSISEATNHTKPKVKRERIHRRVARTLRVSPRAVSVSAVILAVFVLGSFFAYQRVPAIAMRVAASRAGFNGQLPANTPSGYAFAGPIDYTKGSISIRFKSNSDDRKFIIMQRPTEWTSESLLSNLVLSSKTRYQTYHDKGLTVFIYNNGDATWVDKGVWYSISSEGALSSQQILTIAGSM